jgi:KDO2-lipid IV(A) lauroyltransferase
MSFTNSIRYRAEAFILLLLMGIFKCIGIDAASAAGGFLGGLIGPRIGTSRKMHENLTRAFPNIPEAERDKIINACWRHLGRILGEYPHLETIARRRTEIIGAEHVTAALHTGKAAILWSGHIGNWEIFAPALALHFNINPSITYRALNNPYADRLLQRARILNGRIDAIPKHHSSGKTLLQHVKDGKCIGILIDQKYNAGLAVSFFGQPAMTNPVAVKLALHYDCALIPFHVERLGDAARFRLTFFPAQNLQTEAGTKRTELELLQECHSLLEDWIRQMPAQWLWMHKRWDSKNLLVGKDNEIL